LNFPGEKVWGKDGFGKVEFPDELQYEIIKEGGKGTSLGGSHQVSLGKGFGIAYQSVVRVRRGFKILPENDTKML
jgi:hypothetical protein